MKKILLFLILISPVCFADEPSMMEVLAWYYPNAEFVVEADPNTPNSELRIIKWKDASPVPTESELITFTQEYKDFLVQKEQDKKDKKDAALTKLKISESELKDALRGIGLNV